MRTKSHIFSIINKIIRGIKTSLKFTLICVPLSKFIANILFLNTENFLKNNVFQFQVN